MSVLGLMRIDLKSFLLRSCVATLGYFVYLNSGASVSENNLRDAAIERARNYISERSMNGQEKEQDLHLIKETKVTRTNSETYLVEMKSISSSLEEVSTSVVQDSMYGNYRWQIECLWSGNKMEVLYAQSYFEDDLD